MTFAHITHTQPLPPPNNPTKAKPELTKSTLQLNPRKYKLEISAYTTLTGTKWSNYMFYGPLEKRTAL